MQATITWTTATSVMEGEGVKILNSILNILYAILNV